MCMLTLSCLVFLLLCCETGTRGKWSEMKSYIFSYVTWFHNILMGGGTNLRHTDMFDTMQTDTLTHFYHSGSIIVWFPPGLPDPWPVEMNTYSLTPCLPQETLTPANCESSIVRRFQWEYVCKHKAELKAFKPHSFGLLCFYLNVR